MFQLHYITYTSVNIFLIINAIPNVPNPVNCTITVIDTCHCVKTDTGYGFLHNTMMRWLDRYHDTEQDLNTTDYCSQLLHQEKQYTQWKPATA